MAVKQDPSVLDPTRVYMLGEVAEMLQVPERRIRRWTDEGRLAFVQLPFGRRVLGRHITAFLLANEVPAEDAA
jgi:excisionase family DNA binding protein